MKTIGLLGGMSWESTTRYYKAINEGVKAALGGLHSARICLYSVDFAEIEALQHAGNWAETATILSRAAKSVENGGADFLLNLDIIGHLHDRGAQAVILGCTEIALLVQQCDTEVPLYDTTRIHANQAVELALR